MPTPEHVTRYVDRTDFPAPLDALVRRARDRGAPPDVLSALEALPRREFENERDLFSALPGGGETYLGRQGAGEPE